LPVVGGSFVDADDDGIGGGLGLPVDDDVVGSVAVDPASVTGGGAGRFPVTGVIDGGGAGRFPLVALPHAVVERMA